MLVKPEPIWKRLTTRHLLALFPVGILFALALDRVDDTDVWWHLKAGQWMLQHHAIPRVGLWSWIGVGRPWVAHEWLSEVGMAALWQAAGARGLIVAKAALIAAAFAVVLRHARLRSGSPALAGLFALAAGLTSGPFWSERPQLFTYLLIAWLLLAVERWRRGERRHLWLVPGVVLLWVNLHAGYVMAFFFLALTGAGEAAEQLWARRQGGELDWRRLRHLGAVAGVSVLAALANPHGVEALLYPFRYLGFSANNNGIAEWLSPNFHEARYQAFALVLLAGLAGLICSPRRPRPGDLLAVMLLTVMALFSQRNIPILLIVLAPIAAEHWAAVLAQGSAGGPAEPAGAQLPAANWILLAALAAMVAMRLPLARPELLVRTDNRPVEAIRYLEQHRMAGRMFNWYDWGGYLIWRLDPQYQVFIDGRADVYGQEILSDVITVNRLQPGWQKVLEKYRPDWILWPADSPLAEVLSRSPAWRETYRDHMAVIYVREKVRGPEGLGPSAEIPR